eukprot:COSAG01_NODE_440_length_17033_cov_16.301110_3_plen_309_part_00
MARVLLQCTILLGVFRAACTAVPTLGRQPYTVKLATHLETPPRAGMAWSDGASSGDRRVQFASPSGPPADPAAGPPPASATGPTWNVGLQLLSQRKQCAWWELQSEPGTARQCVCWPLANASVPPPLPDWVSFADFPAGTVLNGTKPYKGRQSLVWRVPIAGNYTHWFFYQDQQSLAPVAFDTRQMLMDIKSITVGPVPPEKLTVPAGCSYVAEPSTPPPPLATLAPLAAVAQQRQTTVGGSCITERARPGATATYVCGDTPGTLASATVTVPPSCPPVGCGLVVDIHGWNMDAEMQEKNSRMRERCV